jgi:hypothetical protein
VTGFIAATGTLTNNGTNVSAGDLVNIDLETYNFVTALSEAKAVDTLTGDGTNVADGDTVTIDNVLYTFQATLTNVAGNVKISTTAALTLTNLFHAINASGGTVGTDYATLCVAHPTVVATNPSGTTVTVTAKALGTNGNNISVYESSAHLAWANPSLTGGVDSIPNEVKVGGSDTVSMTHLYEAINAGANAGTDYSTATVAHPSVSATNPTGTTVVLAGLGLAQDGDSQNSIATTETSAVLSFGAATLTGGVDPDVLTDPITNFPRYATYALVTPASPSGAVAFSLPVGDEAQEVTLYLKTKSGGNAVVAGAFVGGTHLTFSAANQIAKLKFLNGSWLPLVNTGSIA